MSANTPLSVSWLWMKWYVTSCFRLLLTCLPHHHGQNTYAVSQNKHPFPQTACVRYMQPRTPSQPCECLPSQLPCGHDLTMRSVLSVFHGREPHGLLDVRCRCLTGFLIRTEVQGDFPWHTRQRARLGLGTLVVGPGYLLLSIPSAFR